MRFLSGLAMPWSARSRRASKKQAGYEFPDKDRVNKSYTHKLDELIKLAELRECTQGGDEVRFISNRLGFREIMVRREPLPKADPKNAEGLVAAIMKKRGGIFSWLKQYW